jgi:hypothetical protein
MLVFTKLNLLNNLFFGKSLKKLPEMQQISKKQNDLTQAKMNVLAKCLIIIKKWTDGNVKTKKYKKTLNMTNVVS